ncbi:hypothetical protein B0H11DRAFT_1733668, partial [Mycena galericulata]
MTSNSTGVPILPDAEKFEGTGYTGWETKIFALARARGLMAYFDGTCLKPPVPAAGNTTQTASPPPDPTPIYSMTPSYDEWVHRDATSHALIVLNVKNPIGLGLKLDGSAFEAIKSLRDIHNRVTDMGLVNAQRDLHTAHLVPGTPMAEHVARLRNLWKVANDMGAKIEDGQFRTIFISLLGEEWDNVVPVLHTYKTSAEVISFVTMHAERLNRTGAPSTSNPVPQALATNTNFSALRAARKKLTCTNPQCVTAGRKGHTMEDCFWPGGGK